MKTRRARTERSRAHAGLQREWLWPVLGAAILVTTWSIALVQPIRDGDLWWQMAYARDMIGAHTLIPDHTQYTWTPTDGSQIYCAWLAEFALYGMYRLGGLALLFSFRYFCFSIFPLLALAFAWRLRLLSTPLSWSIVMLATCMSRLGTNIKPEIFSVVFMAVIVAVWWNFKISGPAAFRLSYLIPGIVILWVNCHGGIVMGLLFLASVVLGELINGYLGSSSRLSASKRWHLFTAVALVFPALCLTPYGWRYPVELTHLLLNQDIGQLETVLAYAFTLTNYLFLEYLILGAILILALAWPFPSLSKLDWSILLPVLAFVAFYARFVRTTLFLGPVFAFTALFLLGERRHRFAPGQGGRGVFVGLVSIGVSLILGWQVAFYAIASPPLMSWFGFGISYQNPVAEARFVSRYFPHFNVGNDYDIGGYLLWALCPRQKIMIDPRYFPFRKWYSEYRKATVLGRMDSFMQRFPAKLWVIHHRHKAAISWFLRSKEWRFVYYGPVAAVFVRQDVPLPHLSERRATKGILQVKNTMQALDIFSTAIQVADLGIAGELVRSVERLSTWSGTQKLYARALHDYYRGIRAFFERDYERAAQLLESVRANRSLGDPLLAECYNHLAASAWKRREVAKALQAAREAVRLNRTDLNALYNFGVLEWYIGKNRLHTLSNRRGEVWRPTLEQFVARARPRTVSQRQVVEIAMGILQGVYRGQPPLLFPPPPPRIKLEPLASDRARPNRLSRRIRENRLVASGQTSRSGLPRQDQQRSADWQAKLSMDQHSLN